MSMWTTNLTQESATDGTREKTEGKAEIFDPLLQYEAKQNRGKRVKPRDIRDYISMHPMNAESDGGDTVSFGAMEFTLKDSKIPLNRVKINQYMEASLRILRLILTEDNASIPQVVQHVGYLIKIATLAQTFRWEQVLKYDQEYRKSQAELSFPWGADNSFLMQVYLKSTAENTQPEFNNRKRTFRDSEVFQQQPAE